MIKSRVFTGTLQMTNYFLSHKTLSIVSGYDVDDIIMSFSGVTFIDFPTILDGIIEIKQVTFKDLPEKFEKTIINGDFDGDKVFLLQSSNNSYYIIAGNCTITTIKEVHIIQTVKEK